MISVSEIQVHTRVTIFYFQWFFSVQDDKSTFWHRKNTPTPWWLADNRPQKNMLQCTEIQLRHICDSLALVLRSAFGPGPHEFKYLFTCHGLTLRHLCHLVQAEEILISDGRYDVINCSQGRFLWNSFSSIFVVKYTNGVTECVAWVQSVIYHGWDQMGNPFPQTRMPSDISMSWECRELVIKSVPFCTLLHLTVCCSE